MPAHTRRRGYGPARPGCSPRPGSQRRTAGAGHHRRPARPHRTRQCSIMQQVRQRRKITRRMAHRRTSAIGLRPRVSLHARDGLGKKVLTGWHARQAGPARWRTCRWTFPVAHLGAGHTGISPFQGKTAWRVAMIARSTGSPGSLPNSRRLEHRRCPFGHLLGCGQAGAPLDILPPPGRGLPPGQWAGLRLRRAGGSICGARRGPGHTHRRPRPGQRPPAWPWASAWITAWAACCPSILSCRRTSGPSILSCRRTSGSSWWVSPRAG